MMSPMRITISSWALLLVLAAPAPEGFYSARVVGISDGDTLTVLTVDKVQVKVRLFGVDAPESGQDFGAKAKQAASELAFGKVVRVDPNAKDRYGRTVAEVRLPDGRSLNRELVRGGWAWWYDAYAKADRELKALEDEARAARRGLWADKAPISPWDWRKGGATVQAAGFIGNSKSRLYHAANCNAAAKMTASHRVAYKTAAEAERAGYRKAKDCH